MGRRPCWLVRVSEEKKLKILNSILGEHFSSSDEHLFRCPSCGHHKRKLSINLEKNVFKCWVCDWSGKNIYRIIRRYGSRVEKYEWQSFEKDIEIEKFADKLFAPKEIKKHDKINLPNEFISLANAKLPTTSIYPLNYLKSRGIDKKDIIKWKIGYCSSGTYESRVVIPSFDEQGDINYFVTRSYDGDWKKYMNPTASKNIVFNHPYVNFHEPVVLVEGVFDAIKAGDNSIPLLGSTLNERSLLFYEIVKHDTPVYLALDPDASKKTNRIIKLLLSHNIETYLVSVAPYNDVGEMTKDEFASRLETSVLLNSNNYLLSRIIGI